ncbi:hypothetical protein SAMN03159481_05659 [Pseudomonas sp. NFACC56-3]|nr:hypothetical protein SAMN03159481_05659 [Pseudomonas sp. NFACC56-3]
MVKITPNPPRAEDLSAYTTLDTKKLREAAENKPCLPPQPNPIPRTARCSPWSPASIPNRC